MNTFYSALYKVGILLLITFSFLGLSSPP